MSSTSYDDATERAVKAASNGMHSAGDSVDRLSGRAADLARQGGDWAREGSERVRSELSRATDNTLRKVRDDPVRTVLMAAAAGALIYAVMRMVGGRSER
jgi:ElaB/YqjD/DUF883 family membrane-anchored ribosome-binding protein